MQFNNKAIFFEDSDTVKDIKGFYKNLLKKEKELIKQEYADNKFKLNLNDIIISINKFKFIHLNQEEVKQIKDLLNKESKGLDISLQDFFVLKLTAGLSLIDYLIRKNKELPHEFKYTKESEFYIGDFEGVLKDELFEIQSIIGDNPISFYIDISNKSLPFLSFSKTLKENFNIIKNNFVSDMEIEYFDEIVENYLKFKKSLLNK